jgi:hypothetical protein
LAGSFLGVVVSLPTVDQPGFCWFLRPVKIKEDLALFVDYPAWLPTSF